MIRGPIRTIFWWVPAPTPPFLLQMETSQPTEEETILTLLGQLMRPFSFTSFFQFSSSLGLSFGSPGRV